MTAWTPQITDRVLQKMTGAVPKIVKFNKEAGRFQARPLGWVLHVAEGNGSLYNYFNNGVPGARKFSHFWIAKDGTIEQYGSILYKSWAQAAGNSAYWTVETEGFHTEPLTKAQIRSAAILHKALVLAADKSYNRLANKPGEVGIGTHQMGGSAWGGHACPGVKRAPQRQDILDRAKKLTHRIKVK